VDVGFPKIGQLKRLVNLRLPGSALTYSSPDRLHTQIYGRFALGIEVESKCLSDGVSSKLGRRLHDATERNGTLIWNADPRRQALYPKADFDTFTCNLDLWPFSSI